MCYNTTTKTKLTLKHYKYYNCYNIICITKAELLLIFAVAL